MKPIDKIKGEIHMKSKKLLLKRLIPVIVVILTVVFIWLCTSKNDLKMIWMNPPVILLKVH